ncbi:MAG: metal ABC transporter permease [Mycoplasmatales bacterium]
MIAAIVNYSFIQNALLIGLILGIILPLIGLIILFRKIPFIADALGHINMSAIALIYLLNSIVAISFFSKTIIILLWTILGGILIETISQKYQHYKEVSVMVVYSVSIALTMIFLNLSVGFQSSFYNILFGNINTITQEDLITTVIASIIVITILLINFKKILIISIDEDLAKLYNVKLNFQRYLTIILIAITVAMAIKILGVLLVSSLVLIPNLASIRFAKSLKQTIILAIVFTEISFILGFIVAYMLNMSSSAIIVLIAVIIYCLSFVIRVKNK